MKLLEFPADAFAPLSDLDQWQTYEVFHQSNRGEQHKHVGIVHAPNAEMALLFAKEQYARRMKCVNLWVVKTTDVARTEYEDSDMFEPATDKSYRESFGYKETRGLIDRYLKAVKGTSTAHASNAKADAFEEGLTDADSAAKKATVVKKPAVIVGGKK
jgi:ring-1,2-phenylacetyl-CoA epoxidase subunit PaaB